MRVSVCASLTYYYTVDVPDSICATDEEGYTINEAKLVNFCADADPINFSGVNDNVTELRTAMRRFIIVNLL